MDEQRRVAAFVATHGMVVDPANRALDLVSEVGEIAKELNESTSYGRTGEPQIARDEIGDVLFAVLALADSVDVDAGAALDVALGKYAARLEGSGSPGSA